MLQPIFLQIVNNAADTAKKVADTAASTAAAPAKAAPPLEFNMLDMFTKGGWVMYPIAFLLLLALYFGIERLIVIMKANRSTGTFMHAIRDSIMAGNIDSARTLARSTNHPVARVIDKGITRLGKPMREVEVTLESAGDQEIARLENNMFYLSLVARIAPMLGFVGTIAGVIKIFWDISQTGDITIKSMTGGLYQKMITSMAGLMVGVIAFVAYHLLSSMIDKIAHRIDVGRTEFLDLLSEPSK